MSQETWCSDIIVICYCRECDAHSNSCYEDTVLRSNWKLVGERMEARTENWGGFLWKPSTYAFDDVYGKCYVNAKNLTLALACL